ncbi:hypothetical protein ABIC38_006719 [Variovorax sp. 1126]
MADPDGYGGVLYHGGGTRRLVKGLGRQRCFGERLPRVQ